MNKYNQNKGQEVDKDTNQSTKSDGNLLLLNGKPSTVIPEMASTSPIQNFQPIQPVQPVQPVQPIQPIQPIQPVQPIQLHQMIPLAPAIPLNSSMALPSPVPLTQLILQYPPIPSTSSVINSSPAMQGRPRCLTYPISEGLNQSSLSPVQQTYVYYPSYSSK